jgi:formate dehydrogenase subunit delta
MSEHDAAEIRLANKIAVHFGYLPSEQAAAAVADHVTKFWDPRMKKRLFEVAAADPEGLDPAAAAAVALLR